MLSFLFYREEKVISRQGDILEKKQQNSKAGFLQGRNLHLKVLALKTREF
jgi:hypothetical protein